MRYIYPVMAALAFTACHSQTYRVSERPSPAAVEKFNARAPAPATAVLAGGRRVAGSNWHLDTAFIAYTSDGRATHRMPINMDTLFVLGGQPNDTLPLQVGPMAASDRMLVFFDYGDSRLRALNPRGEPLWVMGRRGHGPAEFANPMHVAIAADGSIWIADGGAGRIAVISADGTGFETRRPDVGLVFMRVVPLNERWIGITAAGSPFWAEVAADDRIRTTGGFPADTIASWPAPLRQALVAGSPTDSLSAAVFLYGDRFAIYQATAVRCVGRLPGASPPPPEPTPPQQLQWHALGTVITADTLFVPSRSQYSRG